MSMKSQNYESNSLVVKKKIQTSEILHGLGYVDMCEEVDLSLDGISLTELLQTGCYGTDGK